MLIVSARKFSKKNFIGPIFLSLLKTFPQNWPARDKWNWDYFKYVVGEKEVAVYNNVKSDAYTPINKADGYMKFGEYLDMVKKGPIELADFFVQYFSACTTAGK